jgi:nitrite reductase/ring-hydroxylating ferredoxin subunit
MPEKMESRIYEDDPEFVFVAKLDELNIGQIKLAEGIDRVPICVLNFKGKIFALSGVCTHKGAPLCEGLVKGEYLECPWHKAYFQITTGRHSWPAPKSLRSFPIKIRDNLIYVGRNAKTK